MKPACKDCRFLDTEDPSALDGRCHRYPPADKDGLFPPMMANEWCGEFYPRKPVQEAIEWPGGAVS